MHPQIPSNPEIVWFRRKLSGWFETNRRDFPWRSSSDPYLICISEILLQQTRASSVAGIITEFISQFPTWQAVTVSDIEFIENEIKPLGIYKRRARVIKELARIMIELKEFPGDRKKLEELPGIGQYIANVLLVVLYKKRLPFLDINMSRVLERFFGEREKADIRFDPYLQQLSTKVVNVKTPLEANWMILDFAALVCRKLSPLCSSCVLNSRCNARYS